MRIYIFIRYLTMSKRVKLWNCADVGEWLQKIGLAKYVELFHYNEVYGLILLSLSEDDVKSYPLKMAKLDDMRKFLFHLEKLKFDKCATFMKDTTKLATDSVVENRGEFFPTAENKVSDSGVKGEISFDQSQSKEPRNVFMTSVDSGNQNDESSKFDGSDFAPKEQSENSPKQDAGGDEFVVVDENVNVVQKFDGEIVAKSDKNDDDDDQRPKETETEEIVDGVQHDISSVDSIGSPNLAADEIMLQNEVPSESLVFISKLPKHRRFPFKSGQLVFVSYIEWRVVSVFVMSVENRIKADEDCAKLQEMYNTDRMKLTRLKRRQLRRGMICVVPWSVDNKLYRAEVLEVKKYGVEVLFVDYGNKEVVPFAEVRPLLKAFNYPPLAAWCFLKGVLSPSRVFGDEQKEHLELLLKPWSKVWKARFVDNPVDEVSFTDPVTRSSVQESIVSILSWRVWWVY